MVRFNQLEYIKSILESNNIGYETEVLFIPGRKYRADLVFALNGVYYNVEIDGNIWVYKGGHNGAGRIKDYERDTLAQLLGYKVIRFSTTSTKEYIDTIFNLIINENTNTRID